MAHMFSPFAASKYGTNAAILLQNIYYWCEKNKANDKHFHDGYYWTYNSEKAFSELFWYLSKEQIRTALKKLKDGGAIITGNYNESTYDRTLWYAITDIGIEAVRTDDAKNPEYGDGKNPISMWEISQMEIGKNPNGDGKNPTPIPYINQYKPDDKTTDNKPLGDCGCENPKSCQNNQSEIDSVFEQLWKMYPRKKGKGSIRPATKKKIYEVGLEVMKKCIERYSEYVSGKDEQYIMYGSTFFNSGYVDYLDENYQNQNQPEPKTETEDDDDDDYVEIDRSTITDPEELKKALEEYDRHQAKLYRKRYGFV